eukprot:TRINITY_DN9874_c0_g1_i1.p1 TRINITY_DN9874_c0_g1~~TRINITY_DN9874_c0_g1_i1.p1  ORF type:complete len:144 (-),score=17.62 TRINITY_DN9874_c0_g1_i1:62-493(-)
MHAVVALVLIISCVYAAPTIYTLSAQVRNEFGAPLKLQSATLTKGTFSKKPLDSIPVSNTYGEAWEAAGIDGVFGTITYSATDGPATAIFNFAFAPNNQTYTSKVGPTPWIGGVGPATVSGNNAVYQFWTHEMCMDSTVCQGH